MKAKRLLGEIKKWKVKEGLPIILTFLILGVTAVYTFFSYRQWRSLERTIDVSNRAYVSVNKAGLQTKEPQLGENAVVGVNYINKGNTPALKFNALVSVAAIPPPIREGMEQLPSARIGEARAVLPKDTEMYSVVKSDKPFDQLTLDQIKDGRLVLCIWGVLEYEDFFGKKHKSKFCFVHQPGGDINLDACATNNSMD